MRKRKKNQKTRKKTCEKLTEKFYAVLRKRFDETVIKAKERKGFRWCWWCRCSKEDDKEISADHHWICPITDKYICEICCWYDMDSVESEHCRKKFCIKCEQYEKDSK